jgi:hypothetical protein
MKRSQLAKFLLNEKVGADSFGILLLESRCELSWKSHRSNPKAAFVAVSKAA